MLKLKIEGYRQAKQILDELPNTMQKRMLLAALRGSAKPMLLSARDKVPVKSGKLRRMLKMVRFKERNARKSEVAIAIKPVFDRSKVKGAVNQYYGKFIHEGTREERKTRKAKFLVFQDREGKTVFVRSTKGLKPKPFLEQAYSENSERTAQLFGDELAKAVEQFVAQNFKPVHK